MRLAGKPSWRFEEKDGGDLHLALFARDAAGLVTPAAPDIPPPLLAAVTPRAESASAAVADAVAGQWITWWRRLVGFQSREAQLPHGPAPGADMLAWLRATRQRHVAVFDPPAFESLASTPELREVVSATFADRQRLRHLEERNQHRAAFDYQVVRAAAESAAAEFGVSPGEIDGTVQVLDVQGAWSYLAGPGYALCSPAVTTDPAAAPELLRAVFASRLR